MTRSKFCASHHSVLKGRGSQLFVAINSLTARHCYITYTGPFTFILKSCKNTFYYVLLFFFLSWQVVWRYLLNVYPDGLTGQERMDYMKRKTREYDQLKSEWKSRVSPEDLEFIRGNVLKDVLRTDRAHPYYAGSEDSPHLTALTDLLTTFAITHPQVTMCKKYHTVHYTQCL